MTKQELKNRLEHTEKILKHLMKNFDMRTALIEARVYFGEISKENSTLMKEG